MKKTQTVLLVLIIAACAIWAKPSMNISFGANIGYDRFSINDTGSENPLNLFKQGKITVGLESRTSVFNFMTDFVGEISVLDKHNLYLSGIVAIGPTVDIAQRVGISVVIGPKLQYIIKDGNNGQVINTEGETEDNVSFGDVVWEGLFNWRIMADLIVGSVVRIGVAYTFPTDFSMANHNIEYLVPEWSSIKDNGQFTLCIQMQLI